MAKRKTHIRGSRGRRMADLLRGVDLERVLVVAIDAAKFNPKAMVANYFGGVLAYPFFFDVNREGMALLHRKMQECARRVGAQRILVGMEATGHYHEPIVAALEGYGYQVTSWEGDQEGFAPSEIAHPSWGYGPVPFGLHGRPYAVELSCLFCPCRLGLMPARAGVLPLLR